MSAVKVLPETLIAPVTEALKRSEFDLFKQLIYQEAGINMSDAKQALVSGRLNRRVRHYRLSNYGLYYDFISGKAPTAEQKAERQLAIDLLTTNETYFFREPRHFDFLRDHVLPQWEHDRQPRRLWSAASSTGEEAYTLSMMMQAHSSVPFKVVGTDISHRVIEVARRGRYPIAKSERIPAAYLKPFCLRGIKTMEGVMKVCKKTRAPVSFQHANLQQPQDDLGAFDVIFLRNVLIYFDMPTKAKVVANVCKQLKPGGFLIIGHSESLHGVNHELRLQQSSIYQSCT